MESYPKCIRCGECCREEVCHAGERVYGRTQAPCPGLKEKDGISSCSLYDLCPDKDKWNLSLMMTFGFGCTNKFRKERLIKEKKLARQLRERIEQERAQLKLCL